MNKRIFKKGLLSIAGTFLFLMSYLAEASTRPIFTGSDRAAALMVADGPSGKDDTNQFYDLLMVAPTSQPFGVVQKDVQSPDGIVEIQCRLGRLMPLASCAVIVNRGQGASIDVAKRAFHYFSNSVELKVWARQSFHLDADSTFHFVSVEGALTVELTNEGFKIDYKSII